MKSHEDDDKDERVHTTQRAITIHTLNVDINKNTDRDEWPHGGDGTRRFISALNPLC